MSPAVSTSPWYWSPGTTVLFWQVIGWTILDWLVTVLAVPREYQDYQALALLALAAGQCGTVAGWLALGDGAILVRLAFVAHAMVFAEALKQ